MAKWLARARREIPEIADQGTANSDVRTLSAVMAVPHPGSSEKIAPSNDSNGSTPPKHFSKIMLDEPVHHHLTDAELTRLIRQTAKANNVTETAIRAWLGDEIEALRSGDPAELKAFPTCVEQARLNGDSQDNPLLTINHAATDDHGGESGPVRCADCGHAEKLDHPVLVRCGVGRMAPGACGAWWGTTPHLCIEFAPIITSEARR